MRKVGIFGIAVAGAAWLAPNLASAHSGHGDIASFVHGFAHPVGGLDHILAMVLIGVLAWQLAGRALIAVPATFVALMALGGGLGLAGVSVPSAEIGIALSVIVFGFAVAARLKAPAAAAAVLAGLFAIFHGHAHGAEMPLGAGGFSYALGFLLATALLHAAGIVLGNILTRFDTARDGRTLRLAGAFAAVMGFAILSGMV